MAETIYCPAQSASLHNQTTSQAVCVCVCVCERERERENQRERERERMREKELLPCYHFLVVAVVAREILTDSISNCNWSYQIRGG